MVAMLGLLSHLLLCVVNGQVGTQVVEFDFGNDFQQCWNKCSKHNGNQFYLGECFYDHIYEVSTGNEITIIASADINEKFPTVSVNVSFDLESGCQWNDMNSDIEYDFVLFKVSFDSNTFTDSTTNYAFRVPEKTQELVTFEMPYDTIYYNGNALGLLPAKMYLLVSVNGCSAHNSTDPCKYSFNGTFSYPFFYD